MFQNRSIRRLAALSLFAVAASSHAQRAALTQDADAPVRVPYQENVGTSCQYAGSCTLYFTATPAGHRREVEAISCYLYTGNLSSSVEYVELSSQNLKTRTFVPATAYPGTTWGFNATARIMAFFEPGDVPNVHVFTSQRMTFFTCTLAGREISI